MKAKAVVQCLLFSASPKAVVRTIESLGVVRGDNRWRSWWYPTFSSPIFSCWVLPARQRDSDELGIADTIQGHIAGDLTFESWQRWFTSLAHAAGISDAEAARLIEERTTTLVDCLAYGSEARDPVRMLVVELARLGDGLIWTPGHSWTCRDILARPADLDVALWGDGA